MVEYEKDEVVLGTVDKLIGTSVFVKLDSEKVGVISFSEVAPGRIRNLRDYVNPGQKIVIKILRIDKESGHIDLSLRRVTLKEKKEALERESKEKELFTLLKIVLKDDSKALEIFKKIKGKMPVQEFFDEFFEKDYSFLKDFGLGDKEANELSSMLKEKIKEKRVNIKTDFSLYSPAENGLDKIKNVLSLPEKFTEDKARAKIEIKYFGAPLYSIVIEDKDYKEANKKMKELMGQIEKRAKTENCFFELKIKK